MSRKTPNTQETTHTPTSRELSTTPKDHENIPPQSLTNPEEIERASLDFEIQLADLPKKIRNIALLGFTERFQNVSQIQNFEERYFKLI